jgi:hypothetical protein
VPTETRAIPAVWGCWERGYADPHPLPQDTFFAESVQGQFIYIMPSCDLVIVRFGSDAISAEVWHDYSRGFLTKVLDAMKELARPRFTHHGRALVRREHGRFTGDVGVLATALTGIHCTSCRACATSSVMRLRSRAWVRMLWGLFAVAVGCSAVAEVPELRSCGSDLDCYALSAARPFACWRCDKTVEGGTCVAGDPVAPVQKLDLMGYDSDRIAAFTADRKLTVFAQQSPSPGRSVRTSPAASYLDDLEREDSALLQGPSALSQLAVAGESGAAWCLAVDHRGDSAGFLCLAPCGASECQKVCETCSPATRPALAVQDCQASGECEKLALYVDSERSAVVGKWIEPGGRVHDVPLPAELEPAATPVVLRAQRAADKRFVLAAAQSGSVVPWLALVAPPAGSQPPRVTSGPAPEREPESGEQATIVEIAGAAADGGDAEGEMLLAWIWRDGGKQHMSVAQVAWSSGDEISPLTTVFERTLSGEGRVSVAFAHYGLAASARTAGEGGWTVAFRDGKQAFALRVDRTRTEGTLPTVRQTDADVGDFVVAPHPAGADGSSPFVYVDRSDMQARVQACKP